MISVHGLIPISVKQKEFSLFIQKQVQKEKQFSFGKRWGGIDLFLSGLEFQTIDIELRDNKLFIEVNIRIPVKYRLFFWKKETHVTLRSELSFFVLQTGRQPSFALDNSEINYFNVEGIPNFLNNLFTSSIENSLEVEITRNLSAINHIVQEYISKEWMVPLTLDSKQHNIFINARQFRLAAITSKDGIIIVKLAISLEADVKSQEFYLGDFVFLDISADFRILVTEDILKELLQSYLTSLHIPLISKNIPVLLNEFKLTKQFIELKLQFREWFKGEYTIKLQLVVVHQEIHLHLIEMKAGENLSFIKKGLAKAIEFALDKIIESTAVIGFATISDLINKQIDSPLYFKMGTDAIKINIPKLAFKAIHQGEGEIDVEVGIEKLNDMIFVEF